MDRADGPFLNSSRSFPTALTHMIKQHTLIDMSICVSNFTWY